MEYRGPKPYRARRRSRKAAAAVAEPVEEVPVYAWGTAPPHLRTRRQLRAAGLRPDGQPIVGELRWRRGRRWAYFYDVTLAKPKREPTKRQLEAIERALAARRTCPRCSVQQQYTIPRSLGCCPDCWNEMEPGRRHPVAA